MKSLLFLLFLLIPLISDAQTAPDKYWIQFSDKNESPYSVSNPEEFLSFRAIERRIRYNISIEENDLPVNPAYLSSLDSLGAEIIHSSKWFNGASVKVTDPLILEKIRALPFVSR